MNFVNTIGEYNTYIVFIEKNNEEHIRRINELLKINTPDSIKQSINNETKMMINVYIDSKNIIFVIFDKNKKIKNKRLTYISGCIGKQLYGTTKKYIIISLNESLNDKIIIGIMTGMYRFDKYISDKIQLPTIDIFNTTPDKKSLILANVINEIRGLINEPVNKLNSVDYTRYLEIQLQNLNLGYTVLDDKTLKQNRLNLILAVNMGSTIPPRMIIINYCPELNEKPICLVGKGVMFDTGGLNLKTHDFSDMKTDMTGSAIVYGVIKALAVMGIKRRIIGIMPLVHNDIGPNATHPGDIITSHSKKTVEIVDTDAEGRLILADAISYSAQYNPKLIIDIATLTGQAGRIFGDMATVGMTNNQDVLKQIIASGIEEDEYIWELPLWDEYKEMTKSKIADVANHIETGPGTIMGGAFLSHFIPEKTDWVHLDIAGVSFNENDKSNMYHGATGEILRTLVNYLSK